MITYSLVRRSLVGLTILLLTPACKPTPKPIAIRSTPKEIKQYLDSSKAALTLVHVWATWCQPCRDEFPEILKINDQYRSDGLKVTLVSADDPDDLDTVNAFLREQDSTMNSLVSTKLDQDFMGLFSPNWSGALPASFFFDSKGKLVAEWEGKRSYAEYASTIKLLLKK